ncbi:DUF2284 domain-containing protein [Labilibaculum sp.]|uniref:DUF2284 domain-containing protein n=1 Tax=Labilibaculum sp. TaxID=2060723 RepID=UPI00356AE9C2
MNNFKSSYFQKEHNNHKIEIHYKQIELKKEELMPYLQADKFKDYCKNGCPNYAKKWTCPPHCPSFETYAQNYSKATIYLFYTSPHQFTQAEDKAQEAYDFIKEELQTYLRKREPSDGKLIGANSCEICKTCKLVSRKECHLPEKKRYNLVAFGFHVSQIMTDLFQHELQWAKPNQIPDFVSSVGALLQK